MLPKVSFYTTSILGNLQLWNASTSTSVLPQSKSNTEKQIRSLFLSTALCGATHIFSYVYLLPEKYRGDIGTRSQQLICAVLLCFSLLQVPGFVYVWYKRHISRYLSGSLLVVVTLPSLTLIQNLLQAEHTNPGTHFLPSFMGNMGMALFPAGLLLYIGYSYIRRRKKETPVITPVAEAAEGLPTEQIPGMQADRLICASDKVYKISPRFILAESLCQSYRVCIQAYFEQKKPYLDPELTMHKVAADLNMPLHHLSMVLNECIGSSFTDYVNKYRIEEVKRKLKEMQHLKIESIGYAAGFNSKATFNRVFKKYCQQSPSDYQKASQTEVSA